MYVLCISICTINNELKLNLYVDRVFKPVTNQLAGHVTLMDFLRAKEKDFD